MPLNLLIKPCSSLCNMKCDYCFYNDECENREVQNYGIMDEKTLDALVSRAFEYAKGSVSFSFQGGEPTLCGIGFYEKVLELQKKHNNKRMTVYNSIQTNGRNIDEKWAEFLSKNGFFVGLSLDGTKAAHDKYRKDKDGKGTWEKAVSAADILISKNVDVNVLCVVTEAVAKEPVNVYNTLKKYKYLQFIPCFDPFNNTGKGEDFRNAPSSRELTEKAVCKSRSYSLTCELYKSFLNKIFELYYKDYFSDHPVYIRTFDNYIGILQGKAPEMCGVLGRCVCYGAVEADGSVYPCDFYMTDDYRLGNVIENTFSEMFSSETAKKFTAEPSGMPCDCYNCKYRRICGGGCRREYGKYCKSYRGFFDKNYERLAGLAIKTAFPFSL